MEIKETAMVGTLESGDVAITLDPNPGRGIEIELESDVKPQFGTAIERAVREELDPEVSGDPMAYPTAEIMAQCESYTNLPQEILDLYTSEWLRLKA